MITHYFPAVWFQEWLELIQNYYFGVIKYGIDNRDSMLTRTTFEDTMKTLKADPSWERKNRQNTERKKRQIVKVDEGMEIETVKENTTADDEMKANVPSVDVIEDVRMVEINGRNDETNREKANSLPFYAFQKHGIGI